MFWSKKKEKNPQVKFVKLKPEAILPRYAHSSDSGADICTIEQVIIPAGEVRIIGTGLAAIIPEGYELQVRCRSSLAAVGLMVANGVGTVDQGYRGHLKVLLYNGNKQHLIVYKGDRIAQLILAPVHTMAIEEVSNEEFEKTSTARGAGGFGSTGK